MEKRNREEWMAKRNMLYRHFLNDPSETHLAVAIKALDDQIAARPYGHGFSRARARRLACRVRTFVRDE